MYYVTFKEPFKPRQLTFDDIINGVDETNFGMDTKDTRTYCREDIDWRLLKKLNFDSMRTAVENFNNKWNTIIETKEKSTLYRTYYIPKANGKPRRIDEPKADMMLCLYDLKYMLEKVFYGNYHTCAFAYIPGRSTKMAVQRHQSNHSRWILKTDLHGFFPSTTPKFLYKMLEMTFPICSFVESEYNREQFEKALSVCFLNGGLPQGSPVSPLLTNMMMIPIDYTINRLCHAYHPHICYTRYADDMDFSSEFSFQWKPFMTELNKILRNFEAPYSFASEKTWYGNTNCRNYMLGVKYNERGDITIGHEKKEIFRAMTHKFVKAFQNGNPWTLPDVQKYAGIMSYYASIEPEWVSELMTRYSKKFKTNVPSMIKMALRTA